MPFLSGHRKRTKELMTKTTLLILTAMAWALPSHVVQASLADAAAKLPPAVKERGGLCIVIGDPAQIEVAKQLSESGPWVIHWLAPKGTSMEELRRKLQNEGGYGKISIEPWEADHLPHTDNLANVILVDAGPERFSGEELLRALAPQGIAVVADGAEVRVLVKERPETMGEWTHPWHRPNGSMVASDTYLDVPNGFQWLTSPGFPIGHRKNSAGLILSSGGKTYFITQNVPENLSSTIGKGGEKSSGNHLLARDSFNGVLLWSRLWQGPTKSHSEGVFEALVATPDRLFVSSQEGVAVLDAANGKELALWKTESNPLKLLLEDGTLVVQTELGLTALDPANGEQQWSVKLSNPHGALLHDGRVFILTEMREVDGQWQQKLQAFDLESGKEVWQQPIESKYGRRDTAELRLHFAGAGVLCLIERERLRFLSLSDGRELWSHQSEAESRSGMDSRQVGHFLANDLIWIRNERAKGGREAPEAWVAMDPKTGTKVRELTVTGSQGVEENVNKTGCQPHTATERFVFDPRLSTAWNFEGGERAGFKFARGGCQVGIVPANGLAYIPPNACGCLWHQIRGFLAIGHSTDPGLTSVLPSEVEKGPAFGTTVSGTEEAAWPTYRADERRSGAITEELGSALQPVWSTKIKLTETDLDPEWQLHFGRPITPPVIAGGLVYLAKPQTHVVMALDEATGEEKWRFTAGGRILTPPTIDQGIALVGSSDGFVYALRADDGELIWRRRAAPSDRRIMAYGQIESAWPVAGGVLVKDGVALVAAGRAADADGGMVVHAMDPATGEIRWTQRIEASLYGVQEPMVSDGKRVYLVGQQIDPKTGEAKPASAGSTHLRGGKVGLLEHSWTGIQLALRKQISEWSWGEARGQILSVNGDKAYSFLLDAGDNESSPSTEGGGTIAARGLASEKPAWKVEIPKPAQVEAMVASANKLIIAGSADRFKPNEKGFLAAMDGVDGKETGRTELDAAPVFDGIAAANGSLFAVLKNGSVLRIDTK
jgi:outer membrane protein assembly factor BamB